jgi:phosphatidylglycerophosphate synthase
VTVALLLPRTTPAAAPLTLASGEPLIDHLRDQLRRAGAREVVVGDLRDVVDLASGDEPLLLCSGDLVAHAAVLRHLATDPTAGSVALVLPDAAPDHAAVTEDRNQLTAAGTASDLAGEVTGGFGGAIRVAARDLPALAAAAREAAQVADPLPALDRLVVAFTRTGARIGSHRVRLLVARRVSDQDEVATAEAAVAAVDSDAAELRLAVKERDDFFTTYAVSTWSPHVTRLAARLGLSPTLVTAVSVAFAAVAALLFASGGRSALVTGAVLLYLGFVLDCVDGQLARYTRRFSAWGGWLDTIADRAKEYLVYAGLAVGVERAGLGNGWALAIAAMTLQTVRHMTDTWYGVLHDEAARRPKPAGSAGGGLGDRLGQASARVQADVGSVTYWLKRTVVFPIGERWALIALTVALFNPLVSLVAVLTWGGLAFAYTAALRTLRARSMRVPVLAAVDTTLHRDDGPLARGLGRWAVSRRLPGPLPLTLLAAATGAVALLAAWAGIGTSAAGWTVAAVLVVLLAGAACAGAPHVGASDWLVPAVLRAAEYLFVIAVGVWWRVPAPLVFGLLLVLALHHYDLTARLEKRTGPPPLHLATLGWDGRVAVLTVGAVAGVATVVFGALAAYLAVIFVASAVSGWRNARPRDSRTTQGEVAYAVGERNRR